MQTERARAGPERTQKHKSAKPLLCASENGAPFAKSDFGIFDLGVFRARRMIKKRVAYEIIFVRVIGTDEYKGQRPAGRRRFGNIEPIRRFIDERAGRISSASEMPVKSAFGFFRKINEDRFQANFSRLLIFVEVLAAMEIVFIHDRAAA